MDERLRDLLADLLEQDEGDEGDVLGELGVLMMGEERLNDVLERLADEDIDILTQETLVTQIVMERFRKMTPKKEQ